MKKRFVILPIIAVAVGGHYYVWQKQTNNFAGNIDKQINRFNKQGENDTSFSYAVRKLSGYPAKSVVTYIKPILKDHDNSLSSDGNLVLALDTLGKQIDVKLDGNISIAANQANYGLTSKDGIGCRFQASKEMIDKILTKQEIDTDSYTDLAKNFKHIGCSTEDVVLMEGEKQIASTKNYNFAFNSNPTNDTAKMVDFSVQLKDFEMLYSPISMESLYGLGSNKIIKAATAQAYKDVGKQNFVMSGSVLFDSEKSANFHFNLREFTISNNLYTIDFPIEIKKDEQMLVKHNGTLTLGKEFDEANIRFVKNLWQAVKDTDESDVGLANIIAKIKDGSVSEDLAINAMPQLEKYSAIKTYINASGDSNFINGKIEKIGFSTALFGLNVSGDSNPENTNIEVLCENCDAMIDSFASYSNNVAKLLEAFVETESEKPKSEELITPEKISSIKSFYKEFDSDDNDKNITWKIVKKGNDITISGKKLEDFMQKANELEIPIPPM